jgi:RNA polymerase sigma-70 factor (ECF subfamily)
MYTIAVNLVRDEMRRRKVRKESLSTDLKLDELMESQGTSDQAFEKGLLDRMQASRIWQAIGELPDDQQLAFTLRFRHDLTYDEISRVMKVPEGTVKSWIHHGLKRLRANLQPVKCEG